MAKIKMWIGYGTNSNGENPTYKIFSDVKLCAIHIYARNIGDNNDEKLVDILKTLIREKYYYNENSNSGYGWKYELIIYDDSKK